MHALLLSGIGRTEEAIGSIKKTLFKNFTNFTCWHVFGIVNKKAKDYDQAKKAYQNALKYAPDNFNIMRDLCQLQLHLRDYAGFQESRRVLLNRDPTSRDNWVAFAASCFTNGNYDQASDAVDSMLKVNDNDIKNPMKPI